MERRIQQNSSKNHELHQIKVQPYEQRLMAGIGCEPTSNIPSPPYRNLIHCLTVQIQVRGYSTPSAQQDHLFCLFEISCLQAIEVDTAWEI
jgi:hypothetical protein